MASTSLSFSRVLAQSSFSSADSFLAKPSFRTRFFTQRKPSVFHESLWALPEFVAGYWGLVFGGLEPVI